MPFQYGTFFSWYVETSVGQVWQKPISFVLPSNVPEVTSVKESIKTAFNIQLNESQYNYHNSKQNRRMGWAVGRVGADYKRHDYN